MAERKEYLASPEAEKPVERFKLIDNPWEVLADLQQEIDSTGKGDRVWLKGLDFQAGEFTKIILPVLDVAAQRGADVRITHNPVSLDRTHGVPSYVRGIPFYPNRKQIGESYDRTRAMLDELKKKGNINVELSRPSTRLRRLIPYMGTDHVKIWIVGNTAYLGDFNPEDETFFNMYGFMIKIKVPEFVEKLAEIYDNPPDKSGKIPIDGQNGDSYFVYDMGEKGESKIYDFTNELVRGVKRGGSIFASFPLLPGDELLKNLDDATKRNVNVRAVTSRLSVYGSVPPVYIVNGLTAKHIEKDSDLRFRFAPPGGVHGKGWLFEDEDGKRFWAGSHNQVRSGIRAGTAELNMYSRDPELISQVEDYHERFWEASRTGTPMYARPE